MSKITLKEMPNTVVHCKTRAQYDQLMAILPSDFFAFTRMGYCPNWQLVPVFRGENNLFENDNTRGHIVIELDTFLREQGLDTGHKWKVGDTLRPKQGCSNTCGVFDHHNGKHVVITGRVDGELHYDIYDARAKKISQCWYCFKDEDLELHTPDTLKPEDLKPGDWVEVANSFQQDGKAFASGERYRVVFGQLACASYPILLDVSHRDDMWPVQGGDDWKKGWYLSPDSVGKLRKCSPPQPKTEEPALPCYRMHDEPRPISPPPSPRMLSFKVGEKYVASGDCHCFRHVEYAYIQTVQVDHDGSWCEFTAHDSHGKRIDRCTSSCGCIQSIRPYSSSPSLIMSAWTFIKNKARSKADKALIKAGFVTDDGNLTSEGKEALTAVLFNEKKDALVKLAEEINEENEKEAKSCKC